MKPAPFDYRRPTTLDEALALLSEHEGEAQPIAGGQSLMPMLAFRVVSPGLLVDISGIADLGAILISSDGVRLGATVRWRDIELSKPVFEAQPLLHAAIKHVAHYQIRNRGTVGGSLAHADPAAEMPCIALTCEAVIEVAGRNGTRLVPASEFFLAALTTALEPGELIVSVRLPAWKSDRRWAFEEFSRRRGDFALAGVALFYDLDPVGKVEKICVGAIGCGDTPVRLKLVEKMLTGRFVDVDSIREAAAIAPTEIQPQDDIHASGVYRSALLSTLLERALARAAGVAMPDQQS